MSYQPVQANHHYWQTQATSLKHVALSRFPLQNRVSSVDSDAPVLPPTSVEQTSSSVSLGNLPNLSQAPTALCDMTWSLQNAVLDTKRKSPKRPRALSLSHKSSSGVDSSENSSTYI